MRLLLDMDGPLADFDVACWDVITEEGWDTDIYALSQQRHRYMTDHITSRADRRRLRAVIEEPGWFEGLPVVPGAREGVTQILNEGIDVWVCTKPLEANPTCRDGKGAWLRAHFPELEHKMILAPDKSLVHGDVLLDDAPRLDWIPDATWRPVIFAAPFNGPGSEWDGLTRWTWGDPLSTLIGEA